MSGLLQSYQLQLDRGRFQDVWIIIGVLVVVRQGSFSGCLDYYSRISCSQTGVVFRMSGLLQAYQLQLDRGSFSGMYLDYYSRISCSQTGGRFQDVWIIIVVLVVVRQGSFFRMSGLLQSYQLQLDRGRFQDVWIIIVVLVVVRQGSFSGCLDYYRRISCSQTGVRFQDVWIIIVVLVVVRQGSFSGCLDYYSRISCSQTGVVFKMSGLLQSYQLQLDRGRFQDVWIIIVVLVVVRQGSFSRCLDYYSRISCSQTGVVFRMSGLLQSYQLQLDRGRFQDVWIIIVVLVVVQTGVVFKDVWIIIVVLVVVRQGSFSGCLDYYSRISCSQTGVVFRMSGLLQSYQLQLDRGRFSGCLDYYSRISCSQTGVVFRMSGLLQSYQLQLDRGRFQDVWIIIVVLVVVRQGSFSGCLDYYSRISCSQTGVVFKDVWIIIVVLVVVRQGVVFSMSGLLQSYQLQLDRGRFQDVWIIIVVLVVVRQGSFSRCLDYYSRISCSQTGVVFRMSGLLQSYQLQLDRGRFQDVWIIIVVLVVVRQGSFSGCLDYYSRISCSQTGVVFRMSGLLQSYQLQLDRGRFQDVWIIIVVLVVVRQGSFSGCLDYYSRISCSQTGVVFRMSGLLQSYQLQLGQGVVFRCLDYYSRISCSQTGVVFRMSGLLQSYQFVVRQGSFSGCLDYYSRISCSQTGVVFKDVWIIYRRISCSQTGVVFKMSGLLQSYQLQLDRGSFSRMSGLLQAYQLQLDRGRFQDVWIIIVVLVVVRQGSFSGCLDYYSRISCSQTGVVFRMSGLLQSYELQLDRGRFQDVWIIIVVLVVVRQGSFSRCLDYYSRISCSQTGVVFRMSGLLQSYQLQLDRGRFQDVWIIIVVLVVVRQGSFSGCLDYYSRISCSQTGVVFKMSGLLQSYQLQLDRGSFSGCLDYYSRISCSQTGVVFRMSGLLQAYQLQLDRGRFQDVWIIIVVLVVVRQGSFSGCLDYYSRISCSQTGVVFRMSGLLQSYQFVVRQGVVFRMSGLLQSYQLQLDRGRFQDVWIIIVVLVVVRQGSFSRCLDYYSRISCSQTGVVFRMSGLLQSYQLQLDRGRFQDVWIIIVVLVVVRQGSFSGCLDYYRRISCSQTGVVFQDVWIIIVVLVVVRQGSFSGCLGYYSRISCSQTGVVFRMSGLLQSYQLQLDRGRFQDVWIIIVVLVVVRQGSFSGCLDYYSRISCSQTGGRFQYVWIIIGRISCSQTGVVFRMSGLLQAYQLQLDRGRFQDVWIIIGVLVVVRQGSFSRCLDYYSRISCSQTGVVFRKIHHLFPLIDLTFNLCPDTTSATDDVT